MKRPARRLRDALRALDRALGRAGSPYMVIGGIAVIARGVARTTRDVDGTTPGAPVRPLLAALAAEGVTPRISDAEAFSEATHVLLLRHASSGIDIDLTLAWSPFELEALDAAETVVVAGTAVRVARAEDLVVYKLIGARPVDLADLDELLLLHADDTTTVADLVEPILASTTSTSDVLGVEIEWRIAPLADNCFGSTSVVIGTKTMGFVVNAPASITSTDSWTVPETQATGNYKVCARIDPADEVAETSENDQVVISDRSLSIWDPDIDPALCP